MDTQEMNSSSVTEPINTTLDAAAMAADAIAKATGLQNLEAAAQAIVALESRVKSLEAALPEVWTLVHDMSALIPPSFVARVENFFASHFPAHVAPVAAKTE